MGRDYQSEIPEEVKKAENVTDIPERSMCMWSPIGARNLNESELEEFCEVARVQYGYAMEQVRKAKVPDGSFRMKSTSWENSKREHMIQSSHRFGLQLRRQMV